MLRRRFVNRLFARGSAVVLVAGFLGVIASETPAFAAGTISESPSASATWATGVPYGQTSPAPSGPNYYTTGSATAPAGITVTAKTCTAAVTSTSGPSGGPGIVLGAGAPGGITPYSYGSANSATTSTIVLGQTSTIPDGTYSFSITAYAAGAVCVATTSNYTLTVANATVATVGGGASGTTMGFYDYSYNQSNGQNVDFVDEDTSGTESFSVTSSSGTGFGCFDSNAPAGDSYPNAVTDATPYDHECNIQAAPGDSDDSGVVGASAYPPQTISVTETDPTFTNTSPNYTATIYNAPICGVAPGTTGSLSGTSDTTYQTAGDPTIAEACYDGASGPASTLLTGISASGGTIYANSSPLDGSGGTSLTIMAGPGFNWTGSAGSGEADVDTGTAGLSKQAWDYAVTAVTVTSGSNMISVASGGFPNVTTGMVISGTDIPVGTTVVSISGNSLQMSNNATASPAAETVDFYATTTSAPPSLLTTNTSSVASEASFKSSGDPLNTCPPLPAEVDAGMPFCFEEYETTGAGPSASQVALDYTGQSLPTSQTPTFTLSNPSGSLISSTPETITDSTGACPSTIGSGTTNFFDQSYSCWYGRAGDATPVTVTVNGTPVTVTPTNMSAGDVSEADYTVNGAADATSPGTITLVNVSSGSNMVTTSATSAGSATSPYNDLIGDGVSGTDIPVGTEVTNVVNNGNGTWTFTLSNNASATPSPETLTFYANVLDPPQLNAQFTIPAADVHSGSNAIEVCESTAPQNGNDWEFGLQWLDSQGSLQNGQVCSTGTFTGITATTTTVTNPTSSSITLGSSDTDNATVTGSNSGPTPTGTVSFYECGPTPAAQACTSQANQVGSAVSVSGSGGTATAQSSSFTPTSTGYWCFAGAYSGDGTYNSSSDTTTDECFDVTKASSSSLSNPSLPSMALGQDNADQVTVTGNAAGGSPTGSVTFYECGPDLSPTACTSQANEIGGAVNLTSSGSDTSAATSGDFDPATTGTYCFAAYYSGDSNYTSSSDNTVDECFTVAGAPTSSSSSPKNASIVLGGNNKDTVTVTGNNVLGSPTGTVSFYECGPTATPQTCASEANQVGTAVSVTSSGSDTSTATSAMFTPTGGGYFCFDAVYSGDSNYGGSGDNSATDECFDVTPAASLTTSQPSSGETAVGGSVSDNVSVAGNSAGSAPSGSVTFYECGPTATPEACVSMANEVGSSPVTLIQGAGDVSYAASISFSPGAAGYYCFAAYYGGSSDYSASSDTSTTECVQALAAPTITSFSPTSGPVGTVVTINGTNLVDVTKVTFNGTKATIQADNKATKIKVIVPGGATKGYIVVTTPGGSATSSTKFNVT